MELGKATRRVSSVSNALAATVDGKENSMQRNSGLVTRDSQADTERLAMLSSWVYSNIDVISKLVSHTPIGVQKIIEGEESKPVANHPFEILLRNPNKFMGESFFKRYLVMWLLLRGEAYIMLSPDMTGKLSEMWPLPSNLIEPIHDSQEYIKGYSMKRSKPGLEPIFIPPQYICYIRLPNPFDYHRGLSPISPLRLALETDRHASRWNHDTFTNEAVLRTLISIPPNISRSQFNKIKEEIVDELINNGRRYMVARGGQLSVEQLGLSHKDMEYLRGREFTREEIDRAYGFPAGFWAKEATEANSRTARETLIELAIWPVLQMLADDFKVQILDRYYSVDEIDQSDGPVVALEIQPQDIRAKNVELETKAAEFDYQTMTINEVRLLQGRKPYESGYGQVPWPLRMKEDYVVAYLQSLGQFPLGVYPGITRPEMPGLVPVDVPAGGPQQVSNHIPTESSLLTDLVLDERFTKAADDLRMWQRLNVKSMRTNGELKIDFKSEHLLLDEVAEIREELESAKSIADVKRLFSYATEWLEESDMIMFGDFVKKKQSTSRNS